MSSEASVQISQASTINHPDINNQTQRSSKLFFLGITLLAVAIILEDQCITGGQLSKSLVHFVVKSGKDFVALLKNYPKMAVSILLTTTLISGLLIGRRSIGKKLEKKLTLHYFHLCLLSSKSDSQLIDLFLLKKMGYTVKNASKELKRDEDFARQVITKKPDYFQYMDEALRKNKVFVMETIQKGNPLSALIVEHVTGGLNKDKELLAVALKKNAYAYYSLDKELKQDLDFMANLIMEYSGNSLTDNSPSISQWIENMIEDKPWKTKIKKAWRNKLQANPKLNMVISRFRNDIYKSKAARNGRISETYPKFMV